MLTLSAPAARRHSRLRAAGLWLGAGAGGLHGAAGPGHCPERLRFDGQPWRAWPKQGGLAASCAHVFATARLNCWRPSARRGPPAWRRLRWCAHITQNTWTRPCANLWQACRHAHRLRPWSPWAVTVAVSSIPALRCGCFGALAAQRHVPSLTQAAAMPSAWSNRHWRLLGLGPGPRLVSVRTLDECLARVQRVM